MKAGGLVESVRQRYAVASEVSKYAERAEAGLLDWEHHVFEKYCQVRGQVLDVGCGGGREAIALQRAGYQVTAIDISRPQLEMARTKACALDLSIEFGLCDGAHFDFRDAIFDYVLIPSQVLGNVAGHATRLLTLREAKRVLKQDGVLAFSVHNRMVCEPQAREAGFFQSVPDNAEDGDFMLSDVSGQICYWHYFFKEELTGACEAAGFEILACELARDMGQDGWDTIWVCVCRSPRG